MNTIYKIVTMKEYNDFTAWWDMADLKGYTEIDFETIKEDEILNMSISYEHEEDKDLMLNYFH